MRSSGPVTGRPALLRPSNSRPGTPRAMLMRPSAPRPVLVRPKPPTSTTSGSMKEAPEVVDLDKEETTPPAPKRKAAMAKLTHLGISVSRKKGEAGSTSHSSLPQAVVQSPSVTKPAAAAVAANDNSKKVTVELSESQIKALKALGMM